VDLDLSEVEVEVDLDGGHARDALDLDWTDVRNRDRAFVVYTLHVGRGDQGYHFRILRRFQNQTQIR
jgi:hypothetical protein